MSMPLLEFLGDSRRAQRTKRSYELFLSDLPRVMRNLLHRNIGTLQRLPWPMRYLAAGQFRASSARWWAGPNDRPRDHVAGIEIPPTAPLFLAVVAVHVFL